MIKSIVGIDQFLMISSVQIGKQVKKHVILQLLLKVLKLSGVDLFGQECLLLLGVNIAQ